MRLRLFLLFVFCGGVVAAGACSLNPQPYPPDNYDASADVALGPGPDAAGGTDGAFNGDGSLPGSGDAEVDAPEDAAGDAGDAGDGDAADDATDAADANDDASDAEAEQ